MPRCRVGGLTVETEDPSEATYLQSMPACTRQGTRTWLRNSSDMVWALHSTSTVPGTTALTRTATLKGASFRTIMTSIQPETALLAG